jgi:hypothetical protein
MNTIEIRNVPSLNGIAKVSYFTVVKEGLFEAYCSNFHVREKGCVKGFLTLKYYLRIDKNPAKNWWKKLLHYLSGTFEHENVCYKKEWDMDVYDYIVYAFKSNADNALRDELIRNRGIELLGDINTLCEPITSQIITRLK